jgi:hypothetical protein
MLPMPSAIVWTLLVACSLAGLAWGLRMGLPRDYYDRHDHWRDEPRAFTWAAVNAGLLGLGTGMLVWFVLVVVAEVVTRLTD